MPSYEVDHRMDKKYGLVEINLDNGARCMSIGVPKLWAKPIPMKQGATYGEGMSELIAGIAETRAELDALEQRFAVARDFYDLMGVPPEEL